VSQQHARSHQERSRHKDVAANIKRLRVRCGLTQARLADSLDVSQQQVQKWERGTVSFSTARLESVAKALGCDLSELLISSEPVDATAEQPQRARPLSAMECELLDAFGQVTELAKKRLVLQMTRALAQGIVE
jgi:transcriptional regulator with XRE-family HTH domain